MIQREDLDRIERALFSFERLLWEFKDEVKRAREALVTQEPPTTPPPLEITTIPPDSGEEAIQILMQLGYKEPVAIKMASGAPPEITEAGEIVKWALKKKEPQ